MTVRERGRAEAERSRERESVGSHMAAPVCVAYLYLQRVSERVLAPRVLLRECRLFLSCSSTHSLSLSNAARTECERTLCNERVCPVQSQTNSRSRVDVQQIQQLSNWHSKCKRNVQKLLLINCSRKVKQVGVLSESCIFKRLPTATARPSSSSSRVPPKKFHIDEARVSNKNFKQQKGLRVF